MSRASEFRLMVGKAGLKTNLDMAPSSVMNTTSHQSVAGDSAPPPGMVPNFLHPYSLQQYGVIAQAVCLSVASIVVVLRMYAKTMITKNLGAEDYTCCVSWVGLAAYVALFFVHMKFGEGIHQWDVPSMEMVIWAKLENAQEILYGPVLLITKVSILLLYLRIFDGRHRVKTRTYISTQVVLYFNIVFYIAVTVVKLFECTPRKKIWEPSTPGTCINFYALLYVTGIVNIVSDIAMILLPVAGISALQMGISRKVLAIAAFSAALLAPVMAAFRLIVGMKNGANHDATYSIVSVILWTEAEITIGIICSCVPALPSLVRYWGPKLRCFPCCGRGPGNTRLVGGESVELSDLTNRIGASIASSTTTVEGGRYVQAEPRDFISQAEDLGLQAELQNFAEREAQLLDVLIAQIENDTAEHA